MASSTLSDSMRTMVTMDAYWSLNTVSIKTEQYGRYMGTWIDQQFVARNLECTFERENVSVVLETVTKTEGGKHHMFTCSCQSHHRIPTTCLEPVHPTTERRLYYNILTRDILSVHYID